MWPLSTVKNPALTSTEPVVRKLFIKGLTKDCILVWFCSIRCQDGRSLVLDNASSFDICFGTVHCCTSSTVMIDFVLRKMPIIFKTNKKYWFSGPSIIKTNKQSNVEELFAMPAEIDHTHSFQGAAIFETGCGAHPMGARTQATVRY